MENEKFQFMIKEYEMLYSKFEMHYAAVEKTIGLFFLIVAAIVSANGFLISEINSFSIFSLSEFQMACAAFIFATGSIAVLKVIEHRLLIITYVKTLNQNRKWFDQHVMNEDLEKYSIFGLSYKTPKYYKKYRHFYWEVLGISLLNSTFIALFLVNSGKNFNWVSSHYEIINWTLFIGVSAVFSCLPIIYYKKRATKEV
jgi:hypothetical protein